MTLDTEITQLNRVGKTMAKRLNSLGVRTVKDLLFHFPFRYEDVSQILSIDSLVDGMEGTVQGKIALINTKRSPRRHTLITEAIITDGAGQLRVVWFGQAYISKNLKAGDEVSLSGKIKHDMFGLQMVSPAYEKIRKDADTTHTAKIVPMYPLTRGLTQKQLRFLFSQLTDIIAGIPDWIPQSIRDNVDIMPLAEAIAILHNPPDAESLHHATHRMKFDELFVLQLRAEMVRQSLQTSHAQSIPFNKTVVQDFVEALPFTLTKDQKIAAWEILQDIERHSPMNRLLEGDVGSGKTIVAALVAHNAVTQGFQVLIMAPTDILATQHYASFVDIFKNSNTNIGLYSRTKAETTPELDLGKKPSKAAKKRAVLEAITNKDIDIIIGTHALLGEKVECNNLGLVIVDEQHRFGVKQRKTIKSRSGNTETTPHFLSMTATPIPRSFALTIYGDLDISIIKSMPPGRKPVITRVVPQERRATAYGFIEEQVQKGKQVFVICPLIEEKEDDEKSPLAMASDEKKTVLEEYKKLSEEVFPNLRVGFVHGKLKVKEKDAVMNQFAEGELDILVSTSVVEVGVNIPNATVMMIEGAERFGLAQLHQFRGRVGRSDVQSYCMLFSESNSQKAKERLGFFEKNTDGFALAEYDLEQRGPGEVYGKQQSGIKQFRFASLSDKELIQMARNMAKGIDFNTHNTITQKVEEWERQVHLE